MRYIDADGVAAVGPATAVAAIRRALLQGLDPAAGAARSSVPMSHGQFLLMPAETPTAAGVKVATVAPGNPALGRPRIQAAYLLFDRTTLTLRAILDGTALTTLRTPAVSVAAVLDHLPDRPLRLAVVGAGPQALAHVATIGAVRPLEDATHLVRKPSGPTLDALRLGSGPAGDVLGAADVVVCATSARSPLFDSTLLRDDVIVIAVGSHEPDARELDAALLRRSTVVVEDVVTAMHEAGDVILAIAEGALAQTDLLPMRAVVRAEVPLPRDRPLVFKSVGMAWQDLVVAEAVLDLPADSARPGPVRSTPPPPG